MKYDDQYFAAYASGDQDWERGFTRRAYYYRSVCAALFRLSPDARSLIDIGGGLGFFSFAAASARPQLSVVMSDISDYAVETAKRRFAALPNATAIRQDVDGLGLADASCDIVTSLDVVEHLPRPEILIEQAFRVLKPGGIFFFTTPNPRSLGARIKGGPGSAPVVPADRWNTWFALTDPTHINIRTHVEWRRACVASGFQRIRDGSDGCWDTPYVRWAPLLLQKVLFNGSHQLLMRISPRLPWMLGENYAGFWRKP